MAGPKSISDVVGILKLFKCCDSIKLDAASKGGGVWTLECGRPAQRHDHYMCGEDWCECNEQEGYCEDWYADEVAPFMESWQEFRNKHFPAEFKIEASVSEKGFLYITFPDTF